MATKKTCDRCGRVEQLAVGVFHKDDHVYTLESRQTNVRIDLCEICIPALMHWVAEWSAERHPNEDNDPTWTREEMGLDK